MKQCRQQLAPRQVAGGANDDEIEVLNRLGLGCHERDSC
jgi:hypothetical protein